MANSHNKILVTGSTGFIGNYVIKKLLKSEKTVIATSRKPKDEVSHNWLKDVEYIQADLSEERDNWFSLFRKPDLLIHLAWEGLPNYNKFYHCERNFPENFFFIQNMVENGLSQLTVAGTCMEYGMQNGALKEDMETIPNTSYALAKDCLRKFLQQFQKLIDFKLNWIRIFYLYGKGQSPNSILSQLEASLERGDKVFNMSGGEQLRDYLPAEKVGEYLVKVSMQDEISGIVNCCSGKPISIRKLVENYLFENNAKIELNTGYYGYPDYEPMAFWGNSEKLMMALES